mmetsp:Transcript_36788/g.49748  ORF Transcript_36788/g.49748 Transcript_36788/m.49748 type:complete len:80 (+) Transcript_36788:33-272(+)
MGMKRLNDILAQSSIFTEKINLKPYHEACVIRAYGAYWNSQVLQSIQSKPQIFLRFHFGSAMRISKMIIIQATFHISLH